MAGSINRLCLLFAVTLGCASVSAATPAGAAPRSQPVSIIFDTDMDTDCDDVGALAMLHALADGGEVSILATVVSSKFAYSAPCVEAINRYYGRGGLPIGAPKGDGASTKRGSRYARQIAEAYETRLTTNDDADDAVDVYRRTLAAQPDASVVIVTVGYVTNLRDLLRSKPDKHSKLDGTQLVRTKVKRWVCMGGRYPANLRHGGYGNFMPDPGAVVEAVAKWPGTIYFSGLGTNVLTGRTLDKTPADNPIRRAYKLYLKNKPTRPSWDQTALLFAVRPDAPYWKLRTKGSNLIHPNGTNRWVDKPNLDHHVLVEFAHDRGVVRTVTRTIEGLMMRPPRRASRQGP
jgi:purine nucleosidase